MKAKTPVFELPDNVFISGDAKCESFNSNGTKEEQPVLLSDPDETAIGIGDPRQSLVNTNNKSAVKNVTKATRLSKTSNVTSAKKATIAAKEETVKTVQKKLLALKANHTAAKALDRNLGVSPTPATSVTNSSACRRDATSLNASIISNLGLLRKLKADKASQSMLNNVNKQLLALKVEFKAVTGCYWKSAALSTLMSSPKESLASDVVDNQNLEMTSVARPQSHSVAEIPIHNTSVVDLEMELVAQSSNLHKNNDLMSKDEVRLVQNFNCENDSSVDLSFDEISELVRHKEIQSDTNVDKSVQLLEENSSKEPSSASSALGGDTIEEKMNSSAGLYSCVCGQQFNQLGWYSRHVKTCQNKHICCECNGIFKTKQVLKMHKRKVHKTMFKCLKCEVSVNTHKKLQKHFELVHKIGINCKYCDSVLKNKDSLRKHTAKFHVSKPVQPKKSSREVPSLEGYRCTECPKKYKWPGGLRKHRAQHAKCKSTENEMSSSQNDSFSASSEVSFQNNNLNSDSTPNQNLTENSNILKDPQELETQQLGKVLNQVEGFPNNRERGLDDEIEVIVLNNDGSTDSMGFLKIDGGLLL